MGIRFFCPNGHKLNVKSSLAGKIGFCPKCNARMEIPFHSVCESGEQPDEVKTSRSGALHSASEDFANDAESETPVDDFFRQAVDVSSQDRADVVPRERSGSDWRFDDFDDILKDPTAVWNVRTPDNRQYGPVTSAELRVWIDEKRVVPSMFVHRGGWDTWRAAREVFPELERLFFAESDFLASASPTAVRESNSGSAFSALVDVVHTDSESDFKRRKKATRTRITIVSLAFLIVALLGSLIYVLTMR